MGRPHEQWETNHNLRWAAVRNVAKLLGNAIAADNSREFRDEFARTIGYQDWHDIRHLQDQNCEKLKHILQMLQGPHALAIYKAMKARK